MKLEFKEFQVPQNETPGYFINVLELKDFINFEVKRVYYFTGMKMDKIKTGAHCHKIEEELFAMVQGSCIAVIDRGNGLEEIPMKGPGSAVYFGKYVWHHFKDFSKDAVLLAISSTNYSPDRSDYIEDYDEYKKVIQEMK